MSNLNRKMLIDALVKHETLTIDDLGKEENIGIMPDKGQFKFLVTELSKSGHFNRLNGVEPCTYTITDKGIKEGERLNKE
jgi:hypothetical protein